MSEPMSVISIDDYLAFVDDALEGMLTIVTGLGDELANCCPEVPEAKLALRDPHPPSGRDGLLGGLHRCRLEHRARPCG